MKKIIINEVEHEFSGMTLEEALTACELPLSGVIIELNGAIIGRDRSFCAVAVNDGDRINLFRIVAGG